MLRHDRDRLVEQVGLFGLGLDDERGVIGRRGRGDVLHEGAVRGGCLGVGHHQVVGPGDVLGGQRLAVGPLQSLADVEGPGQAVRRDRPFGRQVRRRLVILVAVGQRRVDHALDEGLAVVDREERVEGRHLGARDDRQRRALRCIGSRPAASADHRQADTDGRGEENSGDPDARRMEGLHDHWFTDSFGRWAAGTVVGCWVEGRSFAVTGRAATPKSEEHPECRQHHDNTDDDADDRASVRGCR